MEATRGYLAEGAPASNRPRYRTVAGGAVSKLAKAIVPPAVGLSVRICQSAGHTLARIYLQKPQATKDRHRREPFARSAIAELTRSIVTPAVAPAGSRQAAGVVLASAYHAKLETTEHRYRQ
jgi:hypothetical protein